MKLSIKTRWLSVLILGLAGCAHQPVNVKPSYVLSTDTARLRVFSSTDNIYLSPNSTCAGTSNGSGLVLTSQGATVEKGFTNRFDNQIGPKIGMPDVDMSFIKNVTNYVSETEINANQPVSLFFVGTGTGFPLKGSQAYGVTFTPKKGHDYLFIIQTSNFRNHANYGQTTQWSLYNISDGELTKLDARPTKSCVNEKW